MNKYQGTGLPEEIDKLDKRLEKIRKKNYEIYVRDKKLTNPVGKEDFFLMHEKHVWIFIKFKNYIISTQF